MYTLNSYKVQAVLGIYLPPLTLGVAEDIEDKLCSHTKGLTAAFFFAPPCAAILLSSCGINSNMENQTYSQTANSLFA